MKNEKQVFLLVIVVRWVSCYREYAPEDERAVVINLTWERQKRGAVKSDLNEGKSTVSEAITGRAWTGREYLFP